MKTSASFAPCTTCVSIFFFTFLYWSAFLQPLPKLDENITEPDEKTKPPFSSLLLPSVGQQRSFLFVLSPWIRTLTRTTCLFSLTEKKQVNTLWEMMQVLPSFLICSFVQGHGSPKNISLRLMEDVDWPAPGISFFF